MRAHLRGVDDASRLLEAFFIRSPLPYLLVGPDTRPLLGNRAYRALFGEDAAALERPFRAAGTPGEVLRAQLVRAFQGESVRADPVWIRAAKGADASDVAVACAFSPVKNADRAVTHVLVAFEDVTATLRPRSGNGEAAFKMQAAVLESMTEGVSVSDEHGVIVYTNPAEDRIFGYARGELLGERVTIQNAYAPEDNERIVAEVIDHLRTHGEWTGEWSNKRKDGTLFTTRSRITALSLEGRMHWVCVQEDITDQVRARRRAAELAHDLEARERQLRLITDAIPAVVGYVGADVRYQFANQAYQDWFGISPAEVVGLHMRDLLGARNYALMESFIERALAGEKVSYENRFVMPNGVLRYVQPSYIPDLDERGRVRGFVVLALDVTERRRAELEVEAERERLRSVLMQAPVAISIRSGPEHVFTLVNPIFQRLLGERPVLGKAMRDVFPALGFHRYMQQLHDVYTSGEPFSTNEARFLLDGVGGTRERFFNLAYQPVRNAQGEVDSVVSFAVEVTEQVEARTRAESLAAAAEAANRSKDEFLALLGHELRNPLSPILTAIELMRMRDDEVFPKERAVIERQVRHVTRLVDDLLDISRITRGKISLERRPIDLTACVSAAVELASPLLEQRHHRVSVQLAPGLLVDGDETRLNQVFANLLANAAKYTPPGGEISVSAEPAGEVARVVVRDSGVGIRPEILPRVFDLFVQERQTIDRSDGGLGLGLAIVRSLVALHGGHVEAESDGEGRGATFTVSLPLAPAADPPGRSVAQPATIARVQGRRVLVVDDNVDAAELLADLLSALGHSVRKAHDGPMALRLVQEFSPEVAFLDIGLPVMDGYELARRIRAETTRNAPRLIALTGYGGEQARSAAREAGFHDHLVKPVDIDVLRRILDDAPRA